MRVIENMGTVNIRTRGLKIAEIIIIDADEQRRWVYEQSLYNVFRHFLDFAAIISERDEVFYNSFECFPFAATFVEWLEVALVTCFADDADIEKSCHFRDKRIDASVICEVFHRLKREEQSRLR